MKVSCKEKDLALKAFYCNPTSYIRSSDEAINALEADGYIELHVYGSRREYCITAKGKAFLRNGGYTQKRKNDIIKYIFGFITTAISSALGAIIAQLIF